MESVGDNLEKQFEEYAKRTHGVLTKLPLIAANTGKNFFQDNFRRQAWLDNRTEPWKKRKPGAKRDTGRAILTDTGRGKRSIRVVQSDWTLIQVGITDQEVAKYMGAHNAGFRGNLTIQSHNRTASRKVGTKELKLKGRQKRVRIGGRKIKIRGAGYQVKTHIRKVNLPKRQFIGNSVYLNNLINRQFIYHLKTI